MEKLGQWLRSAREARGVSLLDVEQAIKVRSKFLAALEEGNLELLPARSYTKGMVRTYAIYLGLDPAKAVQLLEEELGPEEYQIRDVAKSVERPTAIPASLLLAIFILAAVVALFVVLQKEYSQFVQSNAISNLSSLAASDSRSSSDFSSPSQPMPASIAQTDHTVPVTPTQTSTPAPTGTPTPPQELTVETKITDRTWLRVVVDEATVFEGIMTAGETRVWTAKEKILIRSGNAGGVEISFNGKRQGVMGSKGEVIDRVWTRP